MAIKAAAIARPSRGVVRVGSVSLKDANCTRFERTGYTARTLINIIQVGMIIIHVNST